MKDINVQVQALPLGKVLEYQRIVSDLLGTEVTLDESIQMLTQGVSNIATAPAKPKVVKEKKTVAKKSTSSVLDKSIDWSGFDWYRFLDGETHIVTAQEIRDFFGWGKTVNTQEIIDRFRKRLGICAMANGLKLKSSKVKSGSLAGRAIEFYLY